MGSAGVVGLGCGLGSCGVEAGHLVVVAPVGQVQGPVEYLECPVLDCRQPVCDGAEGWSVLGVAGLLVIFVMLCSAGILLGSVGVEAFQDTHDLV